MVVQKIAHYKWLIAAVIVVLGNLFAYQWSWVDTFTNEQLYGMVVGSLVDCAIVAPALIFLHLKKWSFKKAVLFTAGGVVVARLIIPSSFMEPFRYITWTAFAIEGSIVVMELFFIVVFLKHVPALIQTIKSEREPLLFAFPKLAANKTNGNPIVQVLASEMLVFYYAFLSWGKKATEGTTVYKNTMYIAMLIMVFHAAMFEAVAFHWFFHERMPVVAWGHTILSVYGLVFLMADARALVLNPTRVEGHKLYLSNGLMRRAAIYTGHIKAIHDVVDQQAVYHFKVLGNTDEKPAFVLEFITPQTIQFVGGFEKKVTYLGVYADDAQALRKQLENHG